MERFNKKSYFYNFKMKFLQYFKRDDVSFHIQGILFRLDRLGLCKAKTVIGCWRNCSTRDPKRRESNILDLKKKKAQKLKIVEN